MEFAQLLITPGTLLTAFIFFWKQAKASSSELKREITEELIQSNARNELLYRELKDDLKQVMTRNDLLYGELKVELKEEIMSVRKEVSSIRVEMHDMNRRIGSVEGLLMNPPGEGS